MICTKKEIITAKIYSLKRLKFIHIWYKVTGKSSMLMNLALELDLFHHTLG
jgi:hypothetical protein